MKQSGRSVRGSHDKNNGRKNCCGELTSEAAKADLYIGRRPSACENFYLPGLPGSEWLSRLSRSRSESATGMLPISEMGLRRRVMPRSGGVGGVVLVSGGGPTGGPEPALVVYNSPNSLASFSSWACCRRNATWAAITLCRSAIRVHLAHTQSLHLQYRLCPWKERSMHSSALLFPSYPTADRYSP